MLMQKQIFWVKIDEILNNLSLYADVLRKENFIHRLRLPEELIKLAKEFNHSGRLDVKNIGSINPRKERLEISHEQRTRKQRSSNP